ncbi:hypothetical protein Bbelb_393970 [Branchiostoma belcheri]|nr:hypothetical protein Bbelb_393970 [Branchiostoma belcheri]
MAQISASRNRASGSAQFWTRDDLVPDHRVSRTVLSPQARFGTRAECPKPCLGTEHGSGRANALSQTVPGHGLGHSVRVQNRAWGLSTVGDTRWPCPKPCLVPPITMIDSTSGHVSGTVILCPVLCPPRHGLGQARFGTQQHP